MSGHEVAACLLAVLTAASAAGVWAAVRTAGKDASLAVLYLAAGGLGALYASVGWAWWLVTAVTR